MPKKLKKIELPTEFNYATARFEPILPMRKQVDEDEDKSWYIWVLLAILLLFDASMFYLKFRA
jgi:hypothetical protein